MGDNEIIFIAEEGSTYDEDSIFSGDKNAAQKIIDKAETILVGYEEYVVSGDDASSARNDLDKSMRGGPRGKSNDYEALSVETEGDGNVLIYSPPHDPEWFKERVEEYGFRANLYETRSMARENEKGEYGPDDMKIMPSQGKLSGIKMGYRSDEEEGYISIRDRRIEEDEEDIHGDGRTGFLSKHVNIDAILRRMMLNKDEDKERDETTVGLRHKNKRRKLDEDNPNHAEFASRAANILTKQGEEENAERISKEWGRWVDDGYEQNEEQ